MEKPRESMTGMEASGMSPTGMAGELPIVAPDVVDRGAEQPSVDRTTGEVSRVRAIFGSVQHFMGGAMRWAREGFADIKDRISRHKATTAGVGMLAISGAAIGKRTIDARRHSSSPANRLAFWKH